MEPFFFKSQGDNLFGIYHPAADVMSRKAIVICPPVYAEYFRTYRVIARIADGWARKGYHVLRFDYFGTGDSSGHWVDGGAKRWLLDIDMAVEELLEVSGSDQITMAGVRLGGLLAIMAASTNSAKSVVLWDPIWHGAEYLASLKMTHEKLLGACRDMSISEKRNVAESELAGFELADWITLELPKLDLLSTELTGISDIEMILSDEKFGSDLFSNHCKSQGVTLQSQTIQSDCDWTTHSESSLQVPNIVRGMEDCV
jgi:pimeloyl-ACP methyl ester carboxylesterase